MQALLQVAHLPQALPGIVPHVTPLTVPVMPFSHPAPPYVNRGGKHRPPPMLKEGVTSPLRQGVRRRPPPNPGGGAGDNSPPNDGGETRRNGRPPTPRR